MSDICEGTFDLCSNLIEIIIPNGVTTIGYMAFSDCWRLKKISLPDGLTSIGFGSFCDCVSLENLTIPDSVTTIGDDAFVYCDSLMQITIPEGVNSIGNYAFKECYSLASVYCKSKNPPIGGESMFVDNYVNRKIYVPIESVEEYKKATYWCDYEDCLVGYEF